MLKIAHSISIYLRRAIHGLVLLLPQGFRSTLAKNTMMTRIFLFFDDARYISIKGRQSDQEVNTTDNKIQNIVPISEYQFVEPGLSTSLERELNNFCIKPKISIIMTVFNVDPEWWELAMLSIENQWYKRWELCVVDDTVSLLFLRQR